jgi:hypothetical protein
MAVSYSHLPIQPINVFYSYSHRDEKLRAKLETHLGILRRQGLINEWHDRKIEAGKKWRDTIDANLHTAKIILLLISADFINSDYCFSFEMKEALKKHEAGEARVIPIILRPCVWNILPFGELQALPKDAKPVTTWPNREMAFVDITRGIQRAIEDIALEGGREGEMNLGVQWNNSIADRKEIVRAVQKFLSERGYYEDAIDGIAGKNTKKAILKFQKESGIKIDGLIGPETLGKLQEMIPPRSTVLREPDGTPEPKNLSTSNETCYSCGANVALDGRDHRAYHCSSCGATNQWSD